MARVPTDVERPSEVEGYGPPCTMAWHTSTPVGKPLNDEPADFVLEDRDEIGEVTEILRRAVNRRGEVAFERTGDLEDLIAAGVAHQKRGWAKDFSIQVRVLETYLRRFQKVRSLRQTRQALATFGASATSVTPASVLRAASAES